MSDEIVSPEGDESVIESTEIEEINEEESSDSEVISEEVSEDDENYEHGDVQADSVEEFKEEVEQAIEEGATEEEVESMVKDYQLKVNGKTYTREFDATDDDAVQRVLQRELAGQHAMQEAAELKKLYNQEIEKLRNNPWEVLQELELDPDELNEKYMQERIEELKKTPDQVERESLQKELETARQELEDQRREAEEARFSALQEQESVKLSDEIDEALSSNTKLPKTQKTVARIADAMLWAMENGYEDISVADVIPSVEEEIREEMRELMNQMPEGMLEEYIGKKNIDRLRQKRVNTIKTKSVNQIKPTTKSNQASKSKADKVPAKDWFRNLGN